MSVFQPVQRDSKSYRQGMVLGLTMAETLLLLVFCLLIATASVFRNQLKALSEAQLKQETLSDDLREAQGIIDAMSQKPSDNWQHYLRDYPHIETLKKAGVDLKDAANNAKDIFELMKTQKKGLVHDDITGSIVAWESVKKEFKSTRGEVPTNDEIIAIFREGLQVQTASAKPGGEGAHDWPPIILLSEAKDYHFESGRADLDNNFRAALSGPVMDELLGIIAKYPKASVIEVIGHTDEQAIVGGSTNLDQKLMQVLQQKESVVRLTSADNAGLGLARAVAVAQVLLHDARLKGFAILPYSGAQLVNVGDKLALSGVGGNDRARRRIEIRVREPNKITVPLAAWPTSSISAPPKKSVASPQPTPGEVDTAIAQPRPTLPEPPKPKPLSEPGVKTPFGWFFRN